MDMMTCKSMQGSGTVTVWTPATGKRVILAALDFTLTGDGAVTVYWDTDDAANRVVDLDLQTGSGRAGAIGPIAGPVNGVLKATATAGTIHGTAIGYEA